MYMVLIKGLRYIKGIGEEPTFYPFETPLSLADACIEMIRLNNVENDNQTLGIYYMDESCRTKTNDKEFEKLWYPNTLPRA